MGKGRVGLQKEISKIFTGIQIPKKDVHQASASPAVTGPTHYIPQKPAAPVSPQPVAPAPQKPVAPAPRPYTIPEPANDTASTPKETVYEPPIPPPAVRQQQVTKQAVYDPPKPTIYEPPVPSPAPAKEQISAIKSRLKPLLKILERLKHKLLAPKPGVNPVKQKLMIVLMPILLMVLIAVVANVLLKPTGKGTIAAARSASSAAASAFDGKINWQLPAPYPQNLRDPMNFGALASQSQGQDKESRPAVKGIVYSEDNPCAVVGDRIVSKGDVVNGATVVKINSDSVEFTDGDKSWTQKVER
jgi:hypothetical protein